MSSSTPTPPLPIITTAPPTTAGPGHRHHRRFPHAAGPGHLRWADNRRFHARRSHHHLAGSRDGRPRHPSVPGRVVRTSAGCDYRRLRPPCAVVAVPGCACNGRATVGAVPGGAPQRAASAATAPALVLGTRDDRRGPSVVSAAARPSAVLAAVARAGSRGAIRARPSAAVAALARAPAPAEQTGPPAPVQLPPPPPSSGLGQSTPGSLPIQQVRFPPSLSQIPAWLTGTSPPLVYKGAGDPPVPTLQSGASSGSAGAYDGLPTVDRAPSSSLLRTAKPVGHGTPTQMQPRFAKIDFATYDGTEDPLNWLNQCEQFFRGQRTLASERTWLASYHLRGAV
nr:nascent polypeptide-associated complex subunit alpha, muscle-specific form-like [Aegilops tauschii subsp. strangulata]